ncbi:uncharacterized protein SAMN05421734_102385 [Pelagirhabdus alkalitolerans]|uniref:HD/PDEase domain-containing protein n=1 Tax=Pelagirhabdus alkalitolerans TaxID=1612202 RepID=A0A1G6H9P6_9BACI|nr:HD domain-containing protein [Pelagirhabdus alkalitolerans]SDB90864.1 uncharacterized protein SAMN05421734_102385 [Pelagirhabdus alkalitolerans]
MTDEIIDVDKIKAFVFEQFDHDASGHDALHMQRVAYWARKIAIDEKEDAQLAEITGWVHDCLDDKLFNNIEQQRQLLSETLQAAGLSSSVIQHIINAIETVSFRKQKQTESKLAQIVQDADRLDAIGAIGIARAFTYGSTVNQPMYDHDQKATIDHFDDKLFKLKDQMHTHLAIQTATERTEFLKAFYDQFHSEIAEVDHDI